MKWFTWLINDASSIEFSLPDNIQGIADCSKVINIEYCPPFNVHCSILYDNLLNGMIFIVYVRLNTG